MPELPEVETIRLGLQNSIIGLKITDIEVLNLKSFQSSAETADQYAIGAVIEALERYGKVLVIRLNTGYSLLIHLKMTGQMVLVGEDGQRQAGGHPTKSMAESLPDRSTKVIFRLSDGSTLYFNDQRIFGWIKLVKGEDVLRDTLIARLGPEPLTEAFELKQFAETLKRRPRSPIKAVILDQSTVAGVGNIYADEALHLAKIHPATLSGELSPAQAKRLYEAIRTIIALGIEHGGTSFTNYVNALGGRGDYLAHARVFRRQGLACPVCGTTIIKTRVAGRGTHLCPKCQQVASIKQTNLEAAA
jgi:formamidopyrimidine-DNA glycosylase